MDTLRAIWLCASSYGRKLKDWSPIDRLVGTRIQTDAGRALGGGGESRLRMDSGSSDVLVESLVAIHAVPSAEALAVRS